MLYQTWLSFYKKELTLMLVHTGIDSNIYLSWWNKYCHFHHSFEMIYFLYFKCSINPLDGVDAVWKAVLIVLASFSPCEQISEIIFWALEISLEDMQILIAVPWNDVSPVSVPWLSTSK